MRRALLHTRFLWIRCCLRARHCACCRQDFCSISISCEIVSNVCCVKNKSRVLIHPSTHLVTELAYSFYVKLIWTWVRIFLTQIWLLHWPNPNQELFPNTKGNPRKATLLNTYSTSGIGPLIRGGVWGGGCGTGASAGKGAESWLHTCLPTLRPLSPCTTLCPCSFLWGLSSEAQFWKRPKGNCIVTDLRISRINRTFTFFFFFFY